MSSVFDLYQPVASESPKASVGPAPGIGEQVGAAFRTSLDEAYMVQETRLENRYDHLAQALVKRGVPFDRLYQGAITLNGRMLVARGTQRDAVWAALEDARRTDPQAFSDIAGDRAGFEKGTLRRNGGRDRDLKLVERSSTAPWLLGSLGGAMADPVNLATLPIGGGGKTIASIAARGALANGLIEAANTPLWMSAKQRLGEEATWGDAAANIGFATVGGGVLSAAPAWLGRKLARGPSARTLDQVPDTALAGAAQAVDSGMPDIDAAVHVVRRDAEVAAANPFDGGEAAHRAGLLTSLQAMLERAPQADTPPVPRATPMPPGDAIATFKQKVRAAESAGKDHAEARTSSASGRYQFTKRTFKGLWKRIYGGGDAGADAGWANRRFDADVQEKFMDVLIADNSAALTRAGHSITPGNLYLAHFAGSDGATRILSAAPDTPIERLLTPAAVNANDFLKGRSASWVAAWAAKKAGGGGAFVPPGGGRVDYTGDVAVTEVAILRDEAERLRTAALQMGEDRYRRIDTGYGSIQSAVFRPDEIGVDAGLMQFKAGADAAGVTDRLAGITQWDPIRAGKAVVWESLDGRRLIADGHQRLGLAKRLAADNPDAGIMIDALVLREADGFTAADARAHAAMKNIAEGSGSPVDAAKAIKDSGANIEALGLPPRSSLVRTARGLVKLDDMAFRAVVNEQIDPAFAGMIGDRVPDDGTTQAALTALLIEAKPRTAGEAHSLIEQGLAAGIVKQMQTDMFGVLETGKSLFMTRAKVMDRATSEMAKLRRVFGVAADNADTLSQGGNRIDAKASAREALDNAQAIDLVNRLAYRAGPIGDALNDAARAIDEGKSTAKAVKEFIDHVRSLDIDALVRADQGAGNGAGGAGRAFDGGEADARLSTERGDPRLTGDPEPELTPQPFGEPTGLFDVPASGGAKTQAESLIHDANAALRAEVADMDGPGLFAIDDGSEATLGDIMAGFDQQRALVDIVKGCQ